MAYIGKSPQTGAYSILDSLTASATASYTMQLNSVNYIPESAQHLIVSLNGSIQKPNSSFTVSGSTLTFSQALTSSDSIDFIYALGNVLDIGVPSDSTISTAKIIDSAVTNSKLANSSITLNGSAVSLGGSATVGGDNTPMFAVSKSASQNIGQNVTTKITFDNEYIDTDNAFASNKFTCPSGGAGNYSMTMSILFHKLNTTYLKGIEISAYKNGAPINYGNDLGEANFGFIADATQFTQVQGITTFIVTLAENDYVECYGKAIPSDGNDTQVYNYFTHWTGHKLIT